MEINHAQHTKGGCSMGIYHFLGLSVVRQSLSSAARVTFGIGMAIKGPVAKMQLAEDRAHI